MAFLSSSKQASSVGLSTEPSDLDWTRRSHYS
jgi:ribosomal protein L24E